MDSAAPVEAFPWETVPKYRLRDRDAVYGTQYQHRVTNLGIDPGLTVGRVEDWRGAPQAPLGCIRRFQLRARLGSP